MNLRDKDYILAEISRYENSNYNDKVIRNWIRSPNPVEFDGIRIQAEMWNPESEPEEQQ
ncbi:hypothetical protein RSJ42_02445 [Methanosarcina hadiensis]|uniref:hypothetical protein n=1 Tax=Methanosarcina hadiensis TaxID=3078083 RepID=UPI0039778578